MDPWNPLRRLTAARIALGRSGGSLPTRALLDFRLAHARARDAVLAPFDAEVLAERLRRLGEPVMIVGSAAHDRAEFLHRPDLGRRLAPASFDLLVSAAAGKPTPVDIVIIVTDGLSTHAANQQSEPLLAALLPLIRQSGWTIAPLVVARHARVAIQNEIGQIFRARLSLLLVGERPGLASAESLGAYFTYAPAIGRSDANRNCVSNIHAAGLAPEAASARLHYLLAKSLASGISGIGFKDDSPALRLPAQGTALP